jgi:hypothetical protein
MGDIDSGCYLFSLFPYAARGYGILKDAFGRLCRQQAESRSYMAPLDRFFACSGVDTVLMSPGVVLLLKSVHDAPDLMQV